MRKVKLHLFYKKLFKIILEGKPDNNLSPLDFIIIKLLTTVYDIKTNKNFKYLNKNKICLYDTCFFMAYVVRWLHFNTKYLSFSEKETFDKNLLSYLISTFEIVFKCPEIVDLNTNFSRLDFYDKIMEDYYLKTNKNDIIAAFNEFTAIVKSDIINKKFVEFNSSSPLYVLNTVEADALCEQEAHYVLNISFNAFRDEIMVLSSNS